MTPTTTAEAFDVVRGLVRRFGSFRRGRFTIELRGELAGILAVAVTAQKGSTSDRDKALQIKMVAEGSRTNFPSAPASSRDCRLFPIWRSLARRAAPPASRAPTGVRGSVFHVAGHHADENRQRRVIA